MEIHVNQCCKITRHSEKIGIVMQKAVLFKGTTVTVPMTNRLYELLLEYKQSESALSPLDDNMFLFHDALSRYTPQDPTYITKHMRRFMKRIGLPNMSPHDLRHTCASLLIQNGADIKSVQDILGHADASTTLNFYARSDLNGMRKAVEGVFGV